MHISQFDIFRDKFHIYDIVILASLWQYWTVGSSVASVKFIMFGIHKLLYFPVAERPSYLCLAIGPSH